MVHCFFTLSVDQHLFEETDFGPLFAGFRLRVQKVIKLFADVGRAVHANLPLLMFRIYDMVLRPSISYIRKRAMGRKKVWEERILLPLKTETLERIDSALRKDETRLDLVREAIEKELKRRKV
jgi:hypothetical protein